MISTQAWENGRVFDNQGPNGANDWFERRVVEPDAVLQDLAVAFYPGATELEGLSRKWLRDVRACVEIKFRRPKAIDVISSPYLHLLDGV